MTRRATEKAHLPDSWSVRPLGSLLRRTPSYGINAAASEYSPDEPTYIRITDINDDGYFSPDPKVSVRHLAAASFYLEPGDLVFARTGASVGKSYRYRSEDGPLVFAGFLIRVSPEQARLDPEFFSYFVQSKRYWDWVRIMSVRSGQPGINASEYARLPVVVPQSNEQRAIASTLAGVDELIAWLQLMIDKKRDIKQGVMQELLTGNTRLPGFEQEWSEARIGDFGRCIRGVSYDPELDLYSGDRIDSVRLLRANNIQAHRTVIADLQYVASRRVKNQQYLRTLDVVICMANGSKALVGKSAIFLVDDSGRRYTFGAFMGAFRTDQTRADARYLAYQLQTGPFRNWISTILAGSSINNLRPKDVEDFMVGVPSVEEQAAIARVLAEMDDELDVLQQRLTKLRGIKRGMSQHLLTGRIRVGLRETMS